MTSVRGEIDAIKARIRSLNELLQKDDFKCPEGIGGEFETMATMLKEAEASYKTKMAKKKSIVASKKESGKVEDKKLPDAIKTIYNVSNELKKLSEIDPDEQEIKEEKKEATGIQEKKDEKKEGPRAQEKKKLVQKKVQVKPQAKKQVQGKTQKKKKNKSKKGKPKSK